MDFDGFGMIWLFNWHEDGLFLHSQGAADLRETGGRARVPSAITSAHKKLK